MLLSCSVVSAYICHCYDVVLNRYFVGAKEYIVRVVTNDFEAEVPAAITTSETSATIDSLTSGETYTFTITAVNLDDQSSSPSAAVVENTCK